MTKQKTRFNIQSVGSIKDSHIKTCLTFNPRIVVISEKITIYSLIYIIKIKDKFFSVAYESDVIGR